MDTTNTNTSTAVDHHKVAVTLHVILTGAACALGGWAIAHGTAVLGVILVLLATGALAWEARHTIDDVAHGR